MAWESAYTFRVSAASYYIGAAPLTSPEQTATLSAADATLDRLDVIALNTSSVVVVIPGTPSATPSEPSVDPAQYLKLGIVLVTHATTAPPALQNVTVYTENAGTPTEWTWTSSGASIVLGSTSTPHAGSKSIEGTAVVAGVYAQGTAAATIDPNAYDHLLLFIRSKASWNNSRGLLVTLRAAGVLIGASAQIRNSGTFGFDSSITSAYQMVAIPIVAFAVPQGTRIDQVRLEDFGGSIGFFVDDISLQVGATSGGAVSGITQDQADARYASLVHATRHQTGGADAIKLDDLAAPDDNSDLNASTSAHGLLRKLSGNATDALKGDGSWGTVTGTPGAHHASHETGGADAIAALSGAVITSGTVAAARLGTHASTHETGGSDAISALSAAVLTSGTVPDARFPATLPAASGANLTSLNASNLSSGTVPSARLAARTGAIGLTIDGGGAVLTTGVKGDLYIPFSCTITASTLIADQSGSVVLDLKLSSSYATTPTVSIVASAPPTLSSASAAQDTTLASWTVSVAAGSRLRYSVTSVSTITRLTHTLTVTVP